jgi:hypothetical protein
MVLRVRALRSVAMFNEHALKFIVSMLVSVGRSPQSWTVMEDKRGVNNDGRVLTWTSRQADPARALVLFEDRLTGAVLSLSGVPSSLLRSDGSTIFEVLMLAQRLGVLLTP